MNTNDNLVSDQKALLERLTTGEALDPDVYQRLRATAERITEELRKKYGDMNIAVDLIREARDES